MFNGKATSRKTAEDLDANDPLAKFKDQFVIKDPQVCYLDGNSLGRLPKPTVKAINDLLDEWGTELVDGWSHWIDEAQPTGDLIGRAALGAAAGQVLAVDTTSTNFFQLCSAAIMARPNRKKIIIDSSNFPTDRYILEGIARDRNLELITLDNDGAGGPGAQPIHNKKELITAEALEPFLSEDVALVTLQAIHYRSGSRPNIKAITDLCRKYGILVVWDCSHAIGAIELNLDAQGVDLAIGCTYKYGNTGPGGTAWLYVNKSIHKELRVPIQGWFAQKDQFAMGPFFEPADDIRRFQIASPSIMGMRAIQASFGMIEEATIKAIEHKANVGTELMIALFDAWLAPLGFELLTPRNPKERGGHITIGHPEAKLIATAMRILKKVVPDYRTPDSIRLAIAPLPTSFVEVYDGFLRLKELVETKQYLEIEDNGSRVT
ncbi:MAG: aminotransferase class V-fold PLP-dependent enzyme [Rhodoluna sp.]|nr:aminotransferase class V-fold PLP-dependent enzyme [Rhodoluna sp.]